MFTHTETEANLLQAVIANPHDDLPRLVYCDELMANAGPLLCTTCGGRKYLWTGDENGEVECPDCDHGVAGPSDGRMERQEFIRTQIALHDWKGYEPPPELLTLHAAADGGTSYQAAGAILDAKKRHDDKRERLELRDDALFRAHATDWFRQGFVGAVETRCGRGITRVSPAPPTPQHPRTPSRFLGVVVKGFVSEIRCQSLQDWIGVACLPCLGHGRPIDYPEGERPPCYRCGGTGGLFYFGHQLVREHPLTRVTVLDKEPYTDRFVGTPAAAHLADVVQSANSSGYWWVVESADGTVAGRPQLPDLYRLPAFLWCHPKISKGEPGRRVAVTFRTPELAAAALSDALLDTARGA